MKLFYFKLFEFKNKLFWNNQNKNFIKITIRIIYYFYIISLIKK
jgi:hypothetical protein